MSSERRAGFLWVLFAAAGYAFLPVFTRMIYTMSDLQPTDIALWRFIVATPIIWLVIALREKWQPHTRPKSRLPVFRLLPMGAFLAGAAWAVFVALQFIPASLFIVLFFTYPAMVAVISVFLGQRLSLAAWIALALTIIGVLLTLPDFSGLQGSSLLGILLALGNGLLVAIYFVVVARVTQGITAMARSTAWIITGTLLSLLLTLPFFGLTLPQSPGVWLLLLGLATVSTAMPIFALNNGIRAIGAPQASIISATEPIMSMTLAVLLLGETVLGLQWLGALLIVAGVIILEARPTGTKAVAKPSP